jgi:hypothetical protein
MRNMYGRVKLKNHSGLPSKNVEKFFMNQSLYGILFLYLQYEND